MKEQKICICAGGIGAKEFAQMEKYAMQHCIIAFMDSNKELGRKVKEEFESVYRVPVFFFHGDVQSEEDRDLFNGAVQEMYGGADYIVCSGN